MKHCRFSHIKCAAWLSLALYLSTARRFAVTVTTTLDDDAPSDNHREASIDSIRQPTVPHTTIQQNKTGLFPFLRDMKSELPPPSSSFDWSKLACSSNAIMADCGFYKCFYPPSDDGNIGYLLATNSDKHPNKGSIHTLQMGWQVAEYFRMHSHNFRHLLAGPPIHIQHPTASDIQFLNEDCATKLVHKSRSRTIGNRYSMAHDIVIQPTTMVQTPHLILGCASSKMSGTFQRWKTFVNEKRSSTIQQFAGQFNADLQSLFQITDVYNVFWNDFQIVVTPTGEVWHLDMDRFFLPSNGSNNDTAIPVNAESTVLHGIVPPLEDRQECKAMLMALNRWVQKAARAG